MFIDEQKIETLLAEKGLTKRALAERCGISAQHLGSVIKRGTCAPLTAGKLAAGLDCRVEEIVKVVETWQRIK